MLSSSYNSIQYQLFVYRECNGYKKLLFNTGYSIQHDFFICTLSNGSKYCYIIPIISFRHTVKEFEVL